MGDLDGASAPGDRGAVCGVARRLDGTHLAVLLSFVRVIMSLMVVPLMVMPLVAVPFMVVTVMAVIVAVSFIVLFGRDGGFGLAAAGQADATEAEYYGKR
jgi:hypothetical protein